MTTVSEVKSWLRPLLGKRLDLALVGRNLVFSPVRHVLRGIYFDASGDKKVCRPKWYLNSLCKNASSFSFEHWGDFYLLENDDPAFLGDLYKKLDSILDLDFTKVETLQDFLDRTEPASLNGLMFNRRALSSTPYSHATVLAGLGRIVEARDALSTALERLHNSYHGHLGAAEAELAKRANSAVAKVHRKFAERDKAALGRVQAFASLLEGGDRAVIAAMLRQWEGETVIRWGLQHLWEPTPLPIELGAGD